MAFDCSKYVSSDDPDQVDVIGEIAEVQKQAWLDSVLALSRVIFHGDNKTDGTALDSKLRLIFL